MSLVLTTLVLTVLSKLPIGMLRHIGRLVAWFALQKKLPDIESGMSGSGARWRVRVNSYIAYPELTECKREAFERQVIVNQYVSLAEALKSWGNHPDYSIRQITKVHNQPLLTQALNSPKGMIAIVLHMGTWEMMNAWLNQFGAPTIMYKPIKNQAVNAFMLKGRERIQATLVRADASGVKAIFKTLKQGGFTIILPDHKPDVSGGVYAPLFGVDTLSSTLVSKLAAKTGCALVGLTCLRRQDGQGFEIYCDDLCDAELWSKNTQVAVGALNRQIEQMINRAPTHYIWNYERFRASQNLDKVYKWSERKLKAHFCHDGVAHVELVDNIHENIKN